MFFSVSSPYFIQKNSLALMMTLNSKRLYIRQIQKCDQEIYIHTLSQDEVMRYITGQGLPLEKAKNKFNNILKENALDPRFGGLALFLKTEQQFIGMGKFSKTDENELEIGYLLLPEYWGQGYGSEIATFLVQQAQKINESPHLKAIIDPHNIASRKILERLGFQPAEEITSDELPGLVLRRPLFL